jgi:hypothetical protein
MLRWATVAALVFHAAFIALAGLEAPRGREDEYRRALGLVRRGPWAKRHLWLGIVAGHVLPLLLLLAPPAAPPALALAGVLALVGLWTEKDVLVRAGQAIPIS